MVDTAKRLRFALRLNHELPPALEKFLSIRLSIAAPTAALPYLRLTNALPAAALRLRASTSPKALLNAAITEFMSGSAQI